MNESYYKIMKLTQPKMLEQIEKLMQQPGMTPSLIYNLVKRDLPQLASLAKRVAEYIESQRDPF